MKKLYTYAIINAEVISCTQEEYQAMVRDAAAKSQDMLILQEMSTDAFNKESVRSYRQRMRLSRPGHVWETLEDEEFLLRIGAVAIANDGQKHPTSAGLLMFGNEYEIVREFNNYFLDYQEHYDENTRWTDRVISSAGDWSGNVYDFYFKVYNKLIQDIKVPFKMDGGSRVDDTPLHQALREALANCLINADYYGRQGIVVNKYKDKITFANPGRFRIEIDAAKSGGISDPRKSTMLKMFTLIDIGKRAGSGIPNIFAVCKNQGWSEPIFIENTEPDRVILEIYLQKIGDKKSAINEEAKQKIMEYFEKHGEAKASDIELAIGLKSSRTRDYLKVLVEEGKLIAVGERKGRIYKLNKQ